MRQSKDGYTYMSVTASIYQALQSCRNSLKMSQNSIVCQCEQNADKILPRQNDMLFSMPFKYLDEDRCDALERIFHQQFLLALRVLDRNQFLSKNPPSY